MTTPPRAVLSEHLEERVRGRRLLAGMFLTFRFDPGFFEQEVLPVFFDIPLSHAPAVKLIQLEDALHSVPHGVAVYYDHNGIIPAAGGGRLDVKRIPICHRAIFHPKNIFALVEEQEPDNDGHRAQALIAASLSANLTRAGWWENVEVCHTEEIAENDRTRLRTDLIGFLNRLERLAGTKASDGHAALKAIHAFLRKTDQRAQRTSQGPLHPHFFDGSTGAFVDFLDSVTAGSLRGMNLEIISPYFDESADTLPLHDLLARLDPKETRVLLPRDETGAALCSKDVFDNLRKLDDVTWARLPADLLRSGKAAGARPRPVHAKVYRFFRRSPKREVLFIGSVNLTSPAHQRGGNLETGFLVELDPPQRPDWWLIADTAIPGSCKHRDEDEGAATAGGTRLTLRFWWNTGQGQAFWDSPAASPRLGVKWQDVELFALEALPPKAWTPLDAAATGELRRVLRSTSILTVSGDGKEPGFLLVQEEGMHARPSLLLDLSPAEILRYWSLLTPAQRAEFLNARAPELAQTDEGAALLLRDVGPGPEETFFDRFAGIFLAFGSLERAIRQALPANPREATYRLFGQKYDSLPNLLKKVMESDATGQGDATEHYVTALCARQLVSELERAYPDLFRVHRDEANVLAAQIAQTAVLRDRLIAHDESRMPEFLQWFDRWFLRRATPVEAEPP